MKDSTKDNSIQDAIIVIDMNKFPEEIREKLPKDLQDKLIEMFRSDYQSSKCDKNNNIRDNNIQNKNIRDNNIQNNDAQISVGNNDTQISVGNIKSSELFAMQQGYVVGNIYKDKIQE